MQTLTNSTPAREPVQSRRMEDMRIYKMGRGWYHIYTPDGWKLRYQNGYAVAAEEPIPTEVLFMPVGGLQIAWAALPARVKREVKLALSTLE